MERYDADPAVAKAIGIIDMATNPFWKQPVAVEVEVAESTVPFKRMDSRTIGQRILPGIWRYGTF